MLGKTQMGVFSISGFIFKSLMNKDGSDDIDMKLGSLAKTREI